MWRTSIPLATHQFPRSPHLFCALCSVLSVFLLWTVLLGPHQDLWLCHLLPIFLFNSFPFFIMVQVFTIPFPPVCDFRQSLSGYIADVAETFESLIWLSERAAWNFLLSSLLPIPRPCVPAAAIYPHWAFSVPQPAVLDIDTYLCLLPPLFYQIAAKVSSYIHFFFFCDLTHPIVSLATSSMTDLIPFQRSGVTSSCAASSAVNLLVTSATNCTAFSS